MMVRKLEKRRISLKKLPMMITFLFTCYVTGNKKKVGIIYILMWTRANESPFTVMEMEHQSFIHRNCKYQNCFITDNKQFFGDLRDFDVVLFNSVTMAEGIKLPSNRTENQLYIYVSIESPMNFPIAPLYNGFFNWTWTYRLDSDINFAYIAVRDKNGKVVGPKENMHWIDIQMMKRTSKYIKSKLQKKHTAAAWFVSHCETSSQRAHFVQNLTNELERYELAVHMFGLCGGLRCPKDRMEECYALVETDYYFYLSFENSLCEDYVTEKLLTALEHYAVPVVFGGANYSRFV